MFTGIVKGLAEVVSINDRQGLRELVVALPEAAQGEIEIGASIAVNGCCLTVVNQPKPTQVQFDVIVESLQRTNLGALSVGDRVNVERSFKVGDEIGGHIISGHIANTCQVQKIEQQGDQVRWQLSLPPALSDYVLSKGFIGLDGCSLTIGTVSEDWFDIHLIPETLARTVFGHKQVGDELNLEVDAQTQAVVDTVKRYLGQSGLANLQAR